MELKFKNNFRGYFDFYYNIIGNKLFIYLTLSIFVSCLDGMGLAMFIPLLQAAAGGTVGAGKQSMGMLHFLTDALDYLGMGLTVGAVLIVLVIIFTAKGLLKFLRANYQNYLRNLFIKKVRYSLVKHLQELSYTGFLKQDAGKIQNTLTVEVQRLFQTMTYYFNSAQAVVMLGTYVLLAFLANYQFAILVAIGTGLSNLAYRKMYKETQKASIDLSSKGNDFNSFLVQAVYHFKYLKATNYFPGYAKKLRRVIDETEHLNRKIGFFYAISGSAKEPMIIIVVALVILFQVNVLGASLGSIVLSLLLFYRALDFLMMVQLNWQNFIQNIGGMNAIAGITEEMAQRKEEQGEALFQSVAEGIYIKNVKFAYGTNRVLNGINIDIPRNRTVALAGESGCGKTTLANMLCGLFVPDSGEILIDNLALSQFNLDSYRRRIGYISQEPVIFNDSIFNNVTFWGEPSAENMQHFWEIIELASLEEFVLNLPGKEHTLLGDNGILISGGQRQRISIARELYKNAEILIFDEATSALDSETERFIQENIDKLHGSYTMLIIAHRLSTIKEADMIYLMDRGKVTASGSFEEMIENSLKFRRMVSLQEV